MKMSSLDDQCSLNYKNDIVKFTRSQYVDISFTSLKLRKLQRKSNNDLLKVLTR